MAIRLLFWETSFPVTFPKPPFDFELAETGRLNSGRALSRTRPLNFASRLARVIWWELVDRIKLQSAAPEIDDFLLISLHFMDA